MSHYAITMTFASKESWVILSQVEQRIKKKIETIGQPFSGWNYSINYGIKTGCNEAFIIDDYTKKRILGNCKSAKELSKTDKIIRPILRGRDIKRYKYDFANLYLIALFPSRHYIIDDFPAIKEYLLSAEWSDAIPDGYGKLKLEQTGRNHIVDGISFIARKETGNQWFETQDQIAYWDDFLQPKIVWGNLCRDAQYCFVPEGIFISAPATMLIPGEKYILAFLNSKIADWYIQNLGVTRNGGYFEYKPMFVGKLPIPRFPFEIKQKLESLVLVIQDKKSKGQSTQNEEELIDKTIAAFYQLDDIEKQVIGFR